MLVSQGGELLLTLWGILGWQDDLEVCTLPSELSSLGSNPDPAVVLVFYRQCDSSMCVVCCPSDGR